MTTWDLWAVKVVERRRNCGFEVGETWAELGQGELGDFERDLRPTGNEHGPSGRPHTSRSTKAGTGQREEKI